MAVKVVSLANNVRKMKESGQFIDDQSSWGANTLTYVLARFRATSDFSNAMFILLFIRISSSNFSRSRCNWSCYLIGFLPGYDTTTHFVMSIIRLVRLSVRPRGFRTTRFVKPLPCIRPFSKSVYAYFFFSLFKYFFVLHLRCDLNFGVVASSRTHNYRCQTWL